MVGRDLIMATLFGSGGGSSGSGGGEGEKSSLDAMIDGSITEVSSDAVMEMRQYAFYKCGSLVSANFPEVTSIPYNGFYEDKALVTADFPKATKIGSNAFSYCTALANVNIHIAEDIGSNAFNNCTALTSVDILVKTKIAAYAFAYCTALKSVILRNTEMSTLSSWSGFDESAIESGTGYIYVPRALVDTYKAATNWSTYADQFRALEDYTVDGTITGDLDPTKI